MRTGRPPLSAAERERRTRAQFTRAILAYAEVDAMDAKAFARAWAWVRTAARRYMAAEKRTDPRRRQVNRKEDG